MYIAYIRIYIDIYAHVYIQVYISCIRVCLFPLTCTPLLSMPGTYSMRSMYKPPHLPPSSPQDIKPGQTVKVKGLDVEWRGPDGRTPLMVAASKGCDDMVEALLYCSANVHVRDKDGYVVNAHWAPSLEHQPGSYATGVLCVHVRAITPDAGKNVYKVKNIHYQ